jgi:hypothetical protein
MADLATLVARGLSDPAIGDALGVSSRTVLRWRRREGLASQWRPPVPPHGSIVRYRPPHRCRCVPCRHANVEAMTAYRAQAQAITAPSATRGYRPWTPEEDAVVLGPGGTAAKAVQLGRTYNAVVQRQTILRKRQDTP